MIRFQAPAMRRAGFPDGMGGGDVTSDSHFGKAGLSSPAGPGSMVKPLRMDEALSHTGGPQSSPGHRPWKGPAIQWT